MERQATDNGRLKVIDALRKLQRGVSLDAWFTMTAISETAGIGHYATKACLEAMAVEGWLWIRHIPERPEKLLYRLRNEYR